MRNIRTLLLGAVKFVVLLVLGATCTVFSIACLPSIGLGIALLSGQAATWLRTLQWNPVPLAALLKESGYSPYVDWYWIRSGIEQLLSLESGPVLIISAAALWTAALIMFDQALKKWRPTARVF
jgi:hypothetical protein